MKKQQPINEMKVTFPSSSANEAFGRAVVAAFAAQLDPTIDELSDLKTAVSEAVTNCIVHAYRDGIGDITLSVKLYEGRRLVIQVKDKGCGIENVQQAMEPLFTTGGEERAGLGFAVMESFMNRLQVASKPGRGTVVTMEKRLLGRPAHGV
ncbi:MAG TPA: anti-sigma F factor [Candidatus Caccousia avistercoris]|nr:anti-sigma F factor [Candidatus Caccousia avistercoris]